MYYSLDLGNKMLTQSAQWQRTDRHGVEPAPPNRTDSRDPRDSAGMLYAYSILLYTLDEVFH